MLLYKIFLVEIFIVVVVVAGCSSDRFTNSSTSAISYPVVIHATPLGQVSSSTLSSSVEGMYSGIPEINMQKPEQITDFNSASPGTDLSPINVAGVWKAIVGGMSCQIATPQTKFANGYRAGPLRCPSAFSEINSWAINGSQLIFYDKIGKNVAILYSSDGARFEGWTVSGERVVLDR